MFRLPSIVLALVLAAGCQKAGEPESAEAAPPPPAASDTQAARDPSPAGLSMARPAPLVPAPEGGGQTGAPQALPDVVARVNGEPITRNELEKALDGIEMQMGQPVAEDERAEVARNVLDQIVSYYLLAQESRARNVVIADADIEAGLQQIRQQFPNEAAFVHALAEQGLTLDRLREETRKDLMVARVLEIEIGPPGVVSDADIRQFYEQNLDQFREGEAVRASHVLIRTPEDATAGDREKAQALAAEVLRKARAGDDFAVLAREYSEDPGSAARGGDLGFLQRGQTVPPFEAAAFGVPPGQISDVVETAFGYHVIRVAERRGERTVPLPEVTDRIGMFLAEQRRQERVNAFIERLRGRGTVEVLL